NLRRLFGPLTSEIIGKSNRINWPIDLRYRQPASMLLFALWYDHILLKFYHLKRSLRPDE
ncbi:hypothetical protein ACR79J_25050, partial [Sphingobacterium multivorum]